MPRRELDARQCHVWGWLFIWNDIVITDHLLCWTAPAFSLVAWVRFRKKLQACETICENSRGRGISVLEYTLYPDQAIIDKDSWLNLVIMRLHLTSTLKRNFSRIYVRLNRNVFKADEWLDEGLIKTCLPVQIVFIKTISCTVEAMEKI